MKKIREFITEEEVILIIINSAKSHEKCGHTYEHANGKLSSLKRRFCKQYIGISSVLSKIKIKDVIRKNTNLKPNSINAVIKKNNSNNKSIPVKSKHLSRAEMVKQDKESRLKPLPTVVPNSTKISYVNSSEFLQSFEWRKLRLQALQLHGSWCQCCGASPSTGAVLNVDHIKPRKKYPELALVLNNLQVLCEECNHGKGNWCEQDFRPKIRIRN